MLYYREEMAVLLIKGSINYKIELEKDLEVLQIFLIECFQQTEVNEPYFS